VGQGGRGVGARGDPTAPAHTARGLAMVLPPRETERFYRIWFPLLNYVNA